MKIEFWRSCVGWKWSRTTGFGSAPTWPRKLVTRRMGLWLFSSTYEVDARRRSVPDEWFAQGAPRT